MNCEENLLFSNNSRFFSQIKLENPDRLEENYYFISGTTAKNIISSSVSLTKS